MKCEYFIGSRVRYCGNWSFRLLTTSGASPAPLVISMTPPDQRNGIIALSFFILPSSFENLSQFLLFGSLSKLYQLSSVISQFSQLTRAGSVEKIRNCSKFDCCFESGYSSITHVGLLKFLTKQPFICWPTPTPYLWAFKEHTQERCLKWRLCHLFLSF